MQFRHGLVAALITLGACTPVVEVTPLHPTPRSVVARSVGSVKVFEHAPDDGVAVYGLIASEGSTDDLNAAIQSKAADLGCDGVVLARSEAGAPTRREVATGQLTAHPEHNAERVTALCIVLK